MIDIRFPHDCETNPLMQYSQRKLWGPGSTTLGRLVQIKDMKGIQGQCVGGGEGR